MESREQGPAIRTASPRAFDNIGPRWLLLTAAGPSIKAKGTKKPVAFPEPPAPAKPHKHAWIVRWTKGDTVIEADSNVDLERKLGSWNGYVAYGLRTGRKIYGGKVERIPVPKVRP